MFCLLSPKTGCVSLSLFLSFVVRPSQLCEQQQRLSAQLTPPKPLRDSKCQGHTIIYIRRSWMDDLLLSPHRKVDEIWMRDDSRLTDFILTHLFSWLIIAFVSSLTTFVSQRSVARLHCLLYILIFFFISMPLDDLLHSINYSRVSSSTHTLTCLLLFPFQFRQFIRFVWSIFANERRAQMLLYSPSHFYAVGWEVSMNRIISTLESKWDSYYGTTSWCSQPWLIL